MDPSSSVKSEPHETKKEEIDPLLADFYSELKPTKTEQVNEKVKNEPAEVKEPEKPQPEEEKPKDKDPLLDDFYSEVLLNKSFLTN
jgi:hypothetical protein